MKVLVVGGGGREHALTWKLAQSSKIDKLYIAPGNPGTAQLGENIAIEDSDLEGLLYFALEKEIDLTIVGPEAPLVAGIVDLFQKNNLSIFGPDSSAARLEGSKVFSKNLMAKYNIPTAEYKVFTMTDEAISYIKQKGAPIVVKAEGLAAGKGVIVAETIEEAVQAVENIMIDEQFGQAGSRIVVEEYLSGEEATLLAFVDGETIVPMIPSQDHKPAYDGDKGPNTGGMGAYAPAPVLDQELYKQVYRDILLPTVNGLKNEGVEYKGILYCGLMIADGKARVLEYNVRFGDPETQVVLPLLETDLVEIIESVIDGRLNECEIIWSDRTSVCVIMASGGYPLEYEKGIAITGINNAEKLEGITVFQAGTADKDGQLVTAGGRVLGVTAVGQDYIDTIKQAYTGVDEIDFAAAHYRKDIGGKAINR